MMQLDALILYNKEGDTRTIRFKPGKLNIITGVSGTGKSSLIGILEYLLGSASPNVPKGPIQESVSWYGLLAHVAESSFFIGRPAPLGATSSEVMLITGTREIPDFSLLETNTNTSDLIRYLGGLEGIGENQIVSENGQNSRAISANFKHSRYYCFQGQNEIANPEILFHHQNLDFQKQTIRDTLPFFLGIQDTETLVKKRHLSELRRKRVKLLNALNEAQLTNTSIFGTIAALLAECRNCGILDVDTVPQSTDDALRILAVILNTSPPNRPIEDVDSTIETNHLLKQRARLREEIRSIDDEIRGLDDFAESASFYDRELNEQRARLATIGLIPNSPAEQTLCPVCLSELDDKGTSHVIQSTLARVSQQLKLSHRDLPHIQSARAELEKRRNIVRAEVSEVNHAITSLTRTNTIQEQAQKSWDIQSFVRGRIAQFLDTVRLIDDETVKQLEFQIAYIDTAIGNLTDDLDPDALRSAVYTEMRDIGRIMTKIAQEIGLEHSEVEVWIDPSRLTVAASTPQGAIYLDKRAIGSGMNWVGYHLAAYLALQTYFITRNRPVPSFIVIDQLSQAFFPQDRIKGEDFEGLNDTDRNNTLKLYRLMYDQVQSLRGRLQIIAFDHANFDEPWFQDSIIESWRDGKALIPDSWTVTSR